MKATKTLEAIEKALVADQGGAFRLLLKEAMPTAGDAYEGPQPPFRNHLGASRLGRECAREIWYGFRWATREDFEGRMVRLFNRGHLEEPRMVALLKMIGVTVYQFDEKGKQFRIGKGHKGHGGGSLDSVLYGVPDFPAEYMLGEFKTHGEKSYVKLLDEGLLKAKWEHYVQCQLYMADQKLGKTLYLAVNKNTDDLHGEIINFDPVTVERAHRRQILIIDSKEAPPKIGKDEADWRCKFCDQKEVCHLGKAPYRTCRTCVHVEMADGGRWGCTKLQSVLTSEEQLAACDRYEIMAGVYAKP
jgi:hypothetical protein